MSACLFASVYVQIIHETLAASHGCLNRTTAVDKCRMTSDQWTCRSNCFPHCTPYERSVLKVHRSHWGFSQLWFKQLVLEEPRFAIFPLIAARNEGRRHDCCQTNESNLTFSPLAPLFLFFVFFGCHKLFCSPYDSLNTNDALRNAQSNAGNWLCCFQSRSGRFLGARFPHILTYCLWRWQESVGSQRVYANNFPRKKKWSWTPCKHSDKNQPQRFYSKHSVQ